MGPRLEIELQLGTHTYDIGDVIPLEGVVEEEKGKLSVRLIPPTDPTRSSMLLEQSLTLIVESNLGELWRGAFDEDLYALCQQITVDGLIWLRIRLYGILSGVLSTLAFTNPIYFETEGE
jgi:hypothetical protein